jgi:hypothetical protein
LNERNGAERSQDIAAGFAVVNEIE